MNTTATTIGTNNVTVTYDGNDTYYSITNSRIFTVEKEDSVINADMPNVKAGTSNLIANITDDEGNPIPDGEVTITTPDGQKIKTTVQNGKINVTVPTTPGRQTYTITYEGNDNYSPGTSSLTVQVPKTDAVLDVDRLSSTVVGEDVSVTGTLKDAEGNPIPDATIKVEYADTTITVTTDADGKYEALVPDVRAGTHDITVTYDGNDTYNSAVTDTSQEVLKIATIVTVEPVHSYVGEKLTLVAHVTDENGNSVSGGNLVFKINGRTLREDDRFDTDEPNPHKFQVVDGVVTYTIDAYRNLVGAEYITATYSGSYKYEANASTSEVAEVLKRSAAVTVTVEPTVAKQNTDIVFVATVTDTTEGHEMQELVDEDAVITFKINGKTLKDENGDNVAIPVENSQATYTYHIPSGTAGVDDTGTVKDYNVSVVYHGKNYHPDARNSTTYNVERSPITISIDDATVTSNKLSVKGSITDYQNNNVVGVNKICVKVNGITYKVNNQTQYYYIQDGIIDIDNIILDVGTKVNMVQIVSGDRQAYLDGRGSTTKITTL